MLKINLNQCGGRLSERTLSKVHNGKTKGVQNERSFRTPFASSRMLH
ncbi:MULTISPECIES: hypothetical protein [Bacillaceae]|nr:hypothetical protein [Bacillus infantis]MDW2876891.1 hypothetical protein [Bacillus infantis]